MLAKRCSWAMPPRSPFSVAVCFGGGGRFGHTGVYSSQGFMLAKQVFCHLSHSSIPFCPSYCGDGVSWSVCLDWPQTWILLISFSQLARIIGVSQQCLTCIRSMYPKLDASASQVLGL
jgi:hypothetical protein